MKRSVVTVLTLAVVLALIAGGALLFRRLRGPDVPETRIAAKRLYTGAATLPGDARDWPHWLGPDRNGISRDTNLAERWPEDGPTELWSADVGRGFASPVAAGGRVYVFSMNDDVETLTCFDANSGQIVWSKEGAAGRTRSYPGTRATPAIDGDDIFTLGGTGELTCREVATGDARWSVDILDETGTTPLDWGMASSPLVDGNRVYVQAGQGGSVALALDRGTGSIVWKSEATGIGGYAHPVLVDVDGTRQLIVFAGKAVMGLNPEDGKTRWREPWTTSYDVHASTPVYRDGNLFVTSAYGTGAGMFKITASGASRLWEKKDVQSRFQPAILDGDALYVNSEGTLMCLSWPDGYVRWKDEDKALKLGVGGSAVRLPDDRMIALGERGRLSLALATPDKLEVISSAQVLDGAEIWAMPLVYGGRLYLKGEQEVVCYDISAGDAAGATQPTAAGMTAATTTAPADVE
jgi:outer membrane protein assembly factor BamB